MAGYYVVPSQPFECPSVRPSAVRFLTLTRVVFDRFSSNFAWTLISATSGLGLQMGLIRYCPRLMKNCVSRNIFRTNGWIMIKFCICLDMYKIHVISINVNRKVQGVPQSHTVANPQEEEKNDKN